MRLSRNDPARALHVDGVLVIDTAAAVGVSAVTNDFYSNFCFDLTKKMPAASSSCGVSSFIISF